MADNEQSKTDREPLFESKQEREQRQAENRQRRHQQIREWAAYVRTHPDEDWGSQVNQIVNAQLQSAQALGDDRPDMDELRNSSLFEK